LRLPKKQGNSKIQLLSKSARFGPLELRILLPVSLIFVRCGGGIEAERFGSCLQNNRISRAFAANSKPLKRLVLEYEQKKLNS
jgi:hypothetical protein